MAKKNARQQKKAAQQLRHDSYINEFMNIGNRGDRSAYSRIAPGRLLTQQELSDIYIGDGFGARIVDCVADEMLRAGFTIDGANDEKAIHSRWDELNLTQHFADAIAWSRLYGGSIVVFGVNDGRDLTDEISDGPLEFVRVYDRHHVQIEEKEKDPAKANFGMPKIYRIKSSGGGEYLIHASRCHVFDGDRLPDDQRQNNQGWGASCLQRVYSALKDFGMSHKHSSSLLEGMQLLVWKYKDLSQICRDDDEGIPSIRNRLNLLDMTRSINNTVAIDADSEAFELLNGNLGGVVELTDSKARVICAVSGIPERILFGDKPKGMNASDSDVPESWKQFIGREQKDKLRPAIEKAISMLTDDQTWVIKFNPLSVMSEKDQAQTDQAQSQADSAYLAGGVISQDELRDTLRQRGRYVMGDEDLLDEKSEAGQDMAASSRSRTGLSALTTEENERV